jgi:CubicO group peptidase (beta-lactamase class C family)
MSATIGDYARFLQMLLNEGVLDGVAVLRAETV